MHVAKTTSRASVTSGYSSDDEGLLSPTAAIGTDNITAETPLLGSPDDQLRPVVSDQFRQTVLILIWSYIFVLMLSATLLTAPSTAIMENIICRNYYPDVTTNVMVADERCKGTDVQGYLAIIRGWASTFECVPGIVGAVPFGIMSDKAGRKPVLFLSTVGLTLWAFWSILVLYFPNVFDVRWYWFSNVFLLIGGGSSVLVAMLYTIAADITPIAERATVFFRLQSTQLVAMLVGAPMTGMLMRWHVWLPIWVALLLLVLVILICLVMPETLGLNTHDQKRPAPADDNQATDMHGSFPETEDTKLSTRIRHICHKVTANFQEMLTFVLGNLRVTFLLLSIVFAILGKFVEEMLLQYSSKRYNWSYDEASTFLAIRPASSLVLLLVVLPGISWLFLHRFKMVPVAKDLWIARVSGVFLTVGAFMIATAVNGYFLMVALVVMSLGSGLLSVVRSLANALVEEHHVGIVNTLIGFMEMVGLLIAGPILSQSLRVGFELGGPWVGLPFLCASFLCALSTVIVWSFRIPHRHLSISLITGGGSA